MNYIIASEGWPFVAIALVFFIIALVIGNNPLTVIALALVIFVTAFFRNPERAVSEAEGAIVSPADGKIVYAGPLADGRYKVSIFMSVFNVHINRIPCDGTVKEINYNKGKFLVASKDKASLENEQNAVTILDSKGREIKFVQIAGLVARRIVCYLKPGDKVGRGERYGLIRFGSRLDVYLPKEFIPAVKEGENVSGGTSTLGKLM